MKVKDKLELELISGRLKLLYAAESDDAIFDVCDHNGSICRSGIIEGEETVCDLTDISSGSYVVYIIDAGAIHTKSFKV